MVEQDLTTQEEIEVQIIEAMMEDLEGLDIPVFLVC